MSVIFTVLFVNEFLRPTIIQSSTISTAVFDESEGFCGGIGKGGKEEGYYWDWCWEWRIGHFSNQCC